MADQPGSRQDCDLLRLVFVSRARPGLTPEDIESLSRRSEARNRAAGLTGLLLHQGETFFCVLEGARRRLFAAMERIMTDPRHAGVEILLEMPIENRRFDFVEPRPSARRCARALQRRLRAGARMPTKVAVVPRASART